MKCIKDETEDCELDLQGYSQGADSTIEAIELIASTLKHGWTGSTDCDACTIISLADAMDILKVIRTKFELVPKKRNRGHVL